MRNDEREVRRQIERGIINGNCIVYNRGEVERMRCG